MRKGKQTPSHGIPLLPFGAATILTILFLARLGGLGVPHPKTYGGAPHTANRSTEVKGVLELGDSPNSMRIGDPLPAGSPNPNDEGMPSSISADHPYGPPVARTDWVITKDYAAHGGHGKWGAVDFAFWHNYRASGAPVVATHAGIVKLLLDDPTYGNLVYVTGPHFTTTYAHLLGFTVGDGAQVVRGTILGKMGSTGHSTGPHVDYQVWLDGDNRNPMDYGINSQQGVGPMAP